MCLAELQRRSNIQMERNVLEDEPPFPADFFVPEEEQPFPDIACVVFHDPEHRVSADLDALERRLRAEIAPRDIHIRFRTLSREDLKSWTPFATRLEEDDYLEAGYARGPGAWGIEAGLPDLPGGGAAHHYVHQESLRSLHCLVSIAQATLQAARGERPRVAWLQTPDEHILAPVCGRESADRHEGKQPEMPIVETGDLLVGCKDFPHRRITILPSIPSTPNSALMQGEQHLRRMHRLTVAALRRQVAFELADPRNRMGGDFDPAAAALWICQTVMTMRLAAEEVRRRYSRAFFRLGADVLAQNREDEALRTRLWAAYRGQRGFAEPRVARVAPSLERRLLTIFYGGAVQPLDEACVRGGPDFPSEDRSGFEWSQVEAFVRWVGDLRRTGRAIFERWAVNMVLHLLDWEYEGEDIRLSTWDPNYPSATCSVATDALLTGMLPQAAWVALAEAALYLDKNACETFAVSYDYVRPGSPQPAGRVDTEGGRVLLVGPLLMLPFGSSARWSELARHLPAENVFYLRPADIH